MLTKLKEILNRHEIFQYGICDYRKLSTSLPCRSASKIPKDACSVIVCLFSYYTNPPKETNLCCYARVPDYHNVVRKLLNEAIEQLQAVFGGEYIAFSDVSPLPEKEAAIRAGVGFPGKNGLVINPVYGSYFVIGEIVTNTSFPNSVPLSQTCAQCGLCIKKCPSGALSDKGFQSQLCLSAVTQRKGELSEHETELIRQGGLIWGCDICQSCCPHNQKIPVTSIRAFSDFVEPMVTEENLSRLMKDRAFGYRGKKLIRRNMEIFEEKNESKS